MIVLTLPYPISANRYWMPLKLKDKATGKMRTIFVPTKEAKAYKEEVAWTARAAGVREAITGRVNLEIDLYPQRPQDADKRAAKNPLGWDDDVRSIDVDNANKVVLDAIRGGVVIGDDKWAWRVCTERMEPDGQARAVLRILPYVRRVGLVVAPQLALPLPCVEKFGNSTKAPEWVDPFKVTA